MRDLSPRVRHVQLTNVCGDTMKPEGTKVSMATGLVPLTKAATVKILAAALPVFGRSLKDPALVLSLETFAVHGKAL